MTTSILAAARTRAGNTFTALRYPNYRLWFIGQIVSLFGTWMQNTAQGYLVYELTRSAAYVGYVSFVSGLPSVLMLIGGVAADRFQRRKVLIATQASMMLLAFILAGLAFLKIVQPWHILALSALLGLVNVFDAPARLALAPELVEREDLTNAIAINAGMFNAAAIIGPAAGALVYAAFGPGWCFLLNGVSFLAVIIALGLMKQRPPSGLPRATSLRAVGGDIIEGVRHVLVENHTVLALLAVMVAVSIFGYSFMPLLPVWAVDVLHGDVRTNGLLRSGQGVGALISALMIASLGRVRFRGRLLTSGLFILPLLLAVFSLLRWLPLSLVLLGGMGFAVVMINNLSNSLIQTNVSDHLRGRVSSIYSLTFFGSMPIGSLIGGEIAERWGAPAALQFGAAALLVCAVALTWGIPRLRRLE